jgi:mRNA-degrading endonuclease RelE of RelBE toxin-antitoxin system
MKYDIEVGQSANGDIDYYDKFDQQIIVKAIIEYLQFDANIETRKKRQLRPNPIAPWELRIGRYRIFYEVTKKQAVKVLAVGQKEHNQAV